MKQVEAGEFREDLYYRLNVLPIKLPPLRERIDDIHELATYLLAKIQKQSQLPELQLSKQALDWLCCYSWPGNIRELRNRLERGCVMAEGEMICPEDLGAFDDLPDKSHISTPSDLKSIKRDTSVRSIQQAIQQCNGNKTEAAKVLGISRASLYQHLKNT
jgi:DNA-binding NtrC family response regulator